MKIVQELCISNLHFEVFSMYLLGSKKQCQKEEEHILDDEAAIETSDYNEEDNESGDSVDEGKEDQDNESPDGGKENQDNESPDEGKENQDNAKNGNSKKRRRRLLTNKVCS